jgi:hypothetical protein
MMCTRSACRPRAATGSRSTARWREQRGRRSAGSWTQGARARAGAPQNKRRRGQSQRTRSSDVARRRCSGRSSDHTSLRHEGFGRRRLRPWPSSLFAFWCRRTAWSCERQQQQACTLWPRQRTLGRVWGTPAPSACYRCISRTCAKQSGSGGRGGLKASTSRHGTGSDLVCMTCTRSESTRVAGRAGSCCSACCRASGRCTGGEVGCMCRACVRVRM